MSFVLTAFTKEIFNEFHLPNINDSDYSIVLSKELFKLPQPLKLFLDVIDGQWKIHSSDDYDIVAEGKMRVNVVIDIGVNFNIRAKSGAVIPVVVMATDERISAPYKVDLSKQGMLTIGSMQENDIVYVEAKLISRHHAKIYAANGRYFVEDISVNGVFLNSKSIHGQAELTFGDCINIFGLKIIFLGRILALTATSGNLFVNNENILRIKADTVADMASRGFAKKEYFNRSPRILGELYTDAVEIEEPPRLNQIEERSLFMTIGPAFTMALPMLLSFLFMMVITKTSGTQTSPYMFIGIITAISSALIGIIWGTVNYKKAIKKSEDADAKRFQAYSDYLRKTTESIKMKYEHNASCLNERYPSCDDCAGYGRNDAQLWSRNVNHEDFMCHRVGIGSVPFQVPIIVPKEKFTIADDALTEKPRLIKEKYTLITNAPVCIDLESNHIIGVVGGANKAGAIEFVKNLSVQIAANNCYTDVKLCYVLDSSNSQSEKLAFTKWLPHVWSEDKKERFYSVDKNEASDLFYELTKVLRYRDELTENSFGKKYIPKPRYILFVENIDFLDGELIAKYIFDNKSEYGLTTVLMSESYELLPNSCECIVFNNATARGIYTPETMSNIGDDIVFDRVETAKAEAMSRRLASIEVNEIETGGEIANSLSFLQMYHVDTIEELNVIDRWRKNRTYTNMKALIGQKAGGADCYLDIHEKYHGPHGLVAGTTGSGKSETLQTYMLSLAVNFSPNDISFFIIDFKGGGMANLFSDLPHLAGQISNLSGNQVHRAMVSIKSENMRRQRIFSEHGVNNINNYTRLFKNNEATLPVPHLFIIIDEFAELKREQPDFMRELISVAQVGRSLGVHLILATQKPAGTVDDNIRSNSKFKLCLRVQDRQDSVDMLQKPDAAYLTQAGRCYLQVGNDEIFELFQSGWSGAVYDKDTLALQSTVVNMITNTGKTALAGNRTLIKKREAIKCDWITSMSDCIICAMKKANVSSSEFVSNSVNREQYTDLIYNELNARSIEFADSASNRIALANLVKLVASFKDDVGQERSKKIIAFAASNNTRLPEKKEKTQLDAVVEYLQFVAASNSYAKSSQLWLPVLPENLYLDALEEYGKDDATAAWSLNVKFGLCDDPTNQAQFPCEVNFTDDGHLVVYGGVVSGKSTMLQTLAWALIKKYSPRELNLYAIDFSNHMLQPFEQSTHFGGIMYETDLDLISKFFFMIRSMLADRRRNIRAGSFSQYITANPDKYPAIILMIDNYAAFKEKTDNAYEDIILELSRDGAGFGIFLVISAGGIGISDLSPKIADNIKSAVALDVGDKLKFSDLLKIHHIDILPEENIKGRGLMVINGSPLEFQTALVFEAENDYKRAEILTEKCKVLSQKYKGIAARAVPQIPEKPTWNDFCNNPDFAQTIEDGNCLPFSYDKENAALYSFNLRETFCLLVSGVSRSGKTNAMKILMASAKEKQSDICLIDKSDRALEPFASKVCDTYVTSAQELFKYLSDLMTEFKKRNAVKREMITSGADDSEVYERMLEFKRIFIFISDVPSFLKLIYGVNEGIGNMSGFVENMLEKGSLHNIYIVADIATEQIPAALGKRAFSLMSSYKSGVYFGGNLASQRLFDFSSIPFSVQNKTMKVGLGVATNGYSDNQARQVVVPIAKGLV